MSSFFIPKLKGMGFEIGVIVSSVACNFLTDEIGFFIGFIF